MSQHNHVRVPSPVRCEHDQEALGIGVAAPRLSWQTEAPVGWRQAYYDIEVRHGEGATETVTVHSEDQVLVPWPVAPLNSRESARMRVRVTGTDGSNSGWSPWADVEAGLLRADDWTARPVRAPWQESPNTERRPYLVRREFDLPGPVVRARLYATAHGVFEAEINGRRVGDDVLSPGWTAYHERLRYRTYDVSDLLHEGPNAIGAWLADGWYRGRLGFNGGHRNLYGTDLSFLGQLEVELADGTRLVIDTDEEWRAHHGPILSSGLYDGEHYDAREEHRAWTRPGFDDSAWRPVMPVERDPATLTAPEQAPVRCTEEIHPVEIRRTRQGTLLFDFGQNLVGRLRVRADGPAGHTIRIRHAEVLQEGELYTRTLRLAPSVDTLVLDGRGAREWEPRFTFHGFRYAEIEGWTDAPVPGDIVARVLHTDMERTGHFDSSDPLLNRLHENIVWSMRGNFLDLPTDCPQRDERLGWTGDIQVFAPTAAFLYNCAGLLSSWLRDLAHEQLGDGTVPWFVPTIPGGPVWTPSRPGAVWGDAAVLTPWVLYRRYADTEILRRQYPSAKAWVDLVERLAGPDRLWKEGFQLGDWLDPTAPPEDPAAAMTDRHLVATAYFAHSARHLAHTARVLGQSRDAAYYGRLADEVCEAFMGAYAGEDGRMSSDTPTAYALALAFDLVPTDLRQSTGDRLAALVRQGGHRISTGFAGTPVVCDALTDTGHLETAYDLLLEEGCPSWMYTVLQGGTTIWERWDSMLPDGTVNPGEMTSFNHYALGAVADWIHRVIGGIAPLEPGYRRVRFAPRPGGRLTHARAEFQSGYGTVACAWELAGGELRCDVEVPVGAGGSVELPGAEAVEVGPGRHSFRLDFDGGTARKNGGAAVKS
ncbi:family 78 glycoside hydrolase catalytic domain [Nocardiopsis oceani]